MSDGHSKLTNGESFANALDPHRRSSLTQALDRVFEGDDVGPEPTVGLVGWEAATLIEEVYDRAGRVVIVEDDPELVESIQQGLYAQNRGKKVKLIESAPSEVSLKADDRVDVAVAAVRSTWIIEGRAAAVLDNVRRNVAKADGTMVPRRLFHMFELTSAPNRVGGLGLKTPRFTRPGEPVPVLSESKHFTTTSFADDGPIPETIDDTIIVKPLLDGRLTALRLTTICELAEGVIQTTSHSGLSSVLVPVREAIDIQAGQPVSIHICYEPGSGLEETRFTARSLPDEESSEWAHADHAVTESFRQRIAEMIDRAKRRERGQDLAKVVDYTIDPHGDVSRLTAFFWTIDEEWRKPVREIVDAFRTEASSQLGDVPSDETIYELMLEVYEQKF
jgi:hypothetical protein